MWTEAQIRLARRIAAAEDARRERAYAEREAKLAAMSPGERAKAIFQTILDQPLVPTGGHPPPWWERAVAWADDHRYWIGGLGWINEAFYLDIVNDAGGKPARVPLHDRGR